MAPTSAGAAVSSPPAHAAIKALAKERGCSVRDLLALAPRNDPFYCGTSADRADAEWFADLWERFTFPLMARAAASGKPVRIFYVSDFEPAGRSMPVAVARKAEFYVRTEFPRIDLRLSAAVLTDEQIRRYRLPRIPIKESERRKAAFEAANGVGATERDALEAVHPGELARLLAAELDRYYDHGLSGRLREAAAAVEDELAEIQEETQRRHETDVEGLHAEYEAIRRQLADWQARAEPVWQAIRDDLAAAAPDPSARLPASRRGRR